MSKSELHNWECAIEKLSGDNIDKMFVIAQDIYNTAFIRGKNYMLLEQTRWIPVSERLPENDTEVLVTREVERGRYVECASYLSGSWISYSDSYKIGRHEVIAWMPLPEAYKGETNGKANDDI